MSLGKIATALLLGASLLLLGSCGGDADTPEAGAQAQAGGPPRPALPSVEELQAAVERDPQDAKVRHLYAVALHKAGRRDEAIAEFERVAELGQDPMYLVELGNAYASVGRMADAETAFQRVLESSPGHSVALYHLGNLARRRGVDAEALSLYAQAIENDPKNLLAHFQLGEALRQAGQLEQAYRSYERVIALEPRHPPEVNAFDASLFHLANIDLQMGATERAVEFLKVLTEAVPDHPSAHLLLGQALSHLGREQEAREQLEIHQRLVAQRPAEAGSPQ